VTAVCEQLELPEYFEEEVNFLSEGMTSHQNQCKIIALLHKISFFK
jgi:hypothetical protein